MRDARDTLESLEASLAGLERRVDAIVAERARLVAEVETLREWKGRVEAAVDAIPPHVFPETGERRFLALDAVFAALRRAAAGLDEPIAHDEIVRERTPGTPRDMVNPERTIRARRHATTNARPAPRADLTRGSVTATASWDRDGVGMLFVERPGGDQ